MYRGVLVAMLAVSLLAISLAGYGYETLQVEGVLLVDPTKPSGWTRKSASRVGVRRPAVRVDSIIHSGLRKLASINGKTLAEGGQWRDVKVIRIESTRVLLAWRGQRWFGKVAKAGNAGVKGMAIRRTQ